MLSLGLKRVYNVCNRVFIRSIRNRRPSSEANPGMQKRLDAFREQGITVQSDNAEEFIENSDSDFYQAGEAYHDHLNETIAGRIELRHHIVKEKYFKENMPNLLTWSEKEQIRHLNTTQPDEWTPERIAESFPVTAAVVKKLLKYPWKPATEQRIARHDATAMRNWRDLREGNLGIPEDMKQHFLKFSNRTIPPINKKSIKIDITPEKNLGEFEQIIRKCAAKENQSTNETEQNETFTNNTEEQPKKVTKKDKEMITLDQLTAKVKQRLDSGSKLDLSDQIMISAVENHEILADKDLVNEIELFDDAKQTGMTEHKKNDDKVVHLKPYPERIRIPKKAYKRGVTYKVDDCFYDDDGKFLYRVLGMTNASDNDKKV